MIKCYNTHTKIIFIFFLLLFRPLHKVKSYECEEMWEKMSSFSEPGKHADSLLSLPWVYPGRGGIAGWQWCLSATNSVAREWWSQLPSYLCGTPIDSMLDYTCGSSTELHHGSCKNSQHILGSWLQENMYLPQVGVVDHTRSWDGGLSRFLGIFDSETQAPPNWIPLQKLLSSEMIALSQRVSGPSGMCMSSRKQRLGWASSDILRPIPSSAPHCGRLAAKKPVLQFTPFLLLVSHFASLFCDYYLILSQPPHTKSGGSYRSGSAPHPPGLVLWATRLKPHLEIWSDFTPVPSPVALS